MRVLRGVLFRRFLGFVPGWLALILALGGTAAAVPPVFNGILTVSAPSSGSMKIYQGDSVGYPHQMIIADGTDGTPLASLGDNTTLGNFSLLRSTGAFSGQYISFGGINPASGNTYPYVERSGGTPDGLNFIVPNGSVLGWRFITRVTESNVTVKALIDASGNGQFASVAGGSGAVTTQGGFNLNNDISAGGKNAATPYISNDLAATNGTQFNDPTGTTNGWRFTLNGGTSVPFQIFGNGASVQTGGNTAVQYTASSGTSNGITLGTANNYVLNEILVPNASASAGSTHQTAIGTTATTVQGLAGSLFALGDNGASTNPVKVTVDTGGNMGVLGAVYGNFVLSQTGVLPNGGGGGYAPEALPLGAKPADPKILTGTCASVATTGTICTFPNSFAFADTTYTCRITAEGSTPAYFSFDTKTTTSFKAYSNAGTPTIDYECSR